MRLKLINKNTDLSSASISSRNWDVFSCNMFWNVYKIEGYIHTLGGKLGYNDFWCCPRDKKPTNENLIPFRGNKCCWDISIKTKNFIKRGNLMDTIYEGVIYRNTQRFYSFTAYSLDYCWNKARELLFQIESHAIDFNSINFKNEIIGRKIYWCNQPAIIKNYTVDRNLYIIPDGIKVFKKTASSDNVDTDMDYFEDDIEADGGITEDLFAPSIFWMRDKEYKKEMG